MQRGGRKGEIILETDLEIQQRLGWPGSVAVVCVMYVVCMTHTNSRDVWMK